MTNILFHDCVTLTKKKATQKESQITSLTEATKNLSPKTVKVHDTKLLPSSPLDVFRHFHKMNI